MKIKHFIKKALAVLVIPVMVALLYGCQMIDTSNNEILSLVVTQSPIYVTVGQSVTINLDATDKNAKVEWVVIDEEIATCEDGVVNGLKVGQTQIAICVGNLTAFLEVNVTDDNAQGGSNTVTPDKNQLDLSLKDLTIELGEVVNIQVTSTASQVVWYSSNSSVAMVNNGKITACGLGEATITVTSGATTVNLQVYVVEKSAQSQSGVTQNGYKLVWQDEFDGNALDLSKWGYQLGTQDLYGSYYGPMYWGNSEFQYYTDSTENVKVADGSLIITAKRQNMGDRTYTSARILTRDKAYFTYGYIEAKIKTPTINGMWPAFWMMPQPSSYESTQNIYGGWPSSGEIDIMEAKGRLKNIVDTTLHFNKNGHQYSCTTTQLKSNTDQWHTYALEWTNECIRWYIDGESVKSCPYSVWCDPSNLGPAPFDQPFYLILNLAVGGQYDGFVEPPADFTDASMYVDYVRVWQKV